jgi:hypothetical protein
VTWIKMRTDLRNHPKVVRIASALKADRLRVVGGLWAVWCTFDVHSEDGTLEGYTLAAIDEDIGWRGFGKAMHAVGWLIQKESGLEVPEFEEHNGASAKRRAQETKRKQRDRSDDPEAHDSWTTVRKPSAPDTGQLSASPPGQVSASDADILRTREELDKRKKYPLPPRDADEGFAEFWSAYPKKVAKEAAAKAFAKLAPDEPLRAVLVAAVRRHASSDPWRKDGGQFIPNAATWLNGRRWEDELPSATVVGDDIFAGAV